MPSLLDLPPEVRVMIFQYMFEKDEIIKLKYVPRMYISTKRLTDRYKDRIAPETALLFISKKLTREYLDILMQHSRIDVSRAFATNVLEKHTFLKTHTYPVIGRLRISQAHFHHPDCPRMLANLMGNLPRLKLLELDVVPDYRVVVPEDVFMPPIAGLQPDDVSAIQERLHTEMVPYTDAMETWRGLSNRFEIVTKFSVSYRPEGYHCFDPVYMVTANFTAQSLVTQQVREDGAYAHHHDLLPGGRVYLY